MQLTARQIRARLERAVADVGSNRALARATGVSETQVSRCRLSGRNVPDALLAAASLWRDAGGDVRDRSDRGPTSFQFVAVQASGEAGVAAGAAMLGAAMLGAALGQR